MKLPIIFLTLSALGCSDYKFAKTDRPSGAGADTGTSSDDTGTIPADLTCPELDVDPILRLTPCEH